MQETKLIDVLLIFIKKTNDSSVLCVCLLSFLSSQFVSGKNTIVAVYTTNKF